MKTGQFLLPLGVVLSLTFIGSSLRAEEVKWTHELVMDLQPNEQLSRWQSAGEGHSTVEKSVLILDSTDKDAIFWKFEGGENDGDWDGSRPSTLEFRVRAREVGSGQDAAGHVVVSDGKNVFAFNVVNPEWHTYRILLSDGQAEVYTDGDLSSRESIKIHRGPEGLEPNDICFGDGGGSVGGITEWEIFRWTNDGAFPP